MQFTPERSKNTVVEALIPPETSKRESPLGNKVSVPLSSLRVLPHIKAVFPKADLAVPADTRRYARDLKSANL